MAPATTGVVHLLTQSAMAVVYCTQPSLVFCFLSLPLFTSLSSHLSLEVPIDLSMGKKKAEIDGLEKNDFMYTVMEILEIGTRLLISQVIASQIRVTNACKLLPSQPSRWHLVKRATAHIPQFLFFFSFNTQYTK